MKKDIVILLFAFLFVWVLFAQIDTVRYDYDRYINAAKNFVAEPSSLYTQNSSEFYYMPWSMIIFIPLSFLPVNIGQSLFMTLSMFIFAFVIQEQNPTRAGIAVAFLNIFLINQIASSQWDIISLLSIFMLYKAAENGRKRQLAGWLLLAICKPIHIILPVLFIIWKYREGFFHYKTILPVGLVGVISLFVSGFDLPIRYIKFVMESPPPFGNISLIQQEYATPFIILSVIISGIILASKYSTKEKLSALIVSNLLLAPYLQTYHLVSCSPAITSSAKKSYLVLIPFSISLLVLYQAVTQNALVLATVPPIFCIGYMLAILCILAIKKPPIGSGAFF